MNSKIILRKPLPEDGMSVSRLISHCPPLDTNSVYCNLLQCSHFADTSVVAVNENGLMGFISGYIIPDRSDTLFIWQVAVAEAMRGEGLAVKMLKHILSGEKCEQLSFIETTITRSNEPSWSLFKRLAGILNTGIDETVMFDRSIHFDDEHDSEILVRLGPFALFTNEKDMNSKKINQLSELI